MRRRSRSHTAIVLASVAAIAGCGGDGGSDQSPAGVVARYYASKNDPPALCATLSRSFAANYGGRDRCEQVVVPSRNPEQHIEVRSVKRDGDRATVVFQIEGGGTGQATVVRENGAWRLDHLTQAPESEQEREREQGGEGEPGPAGEPAGGEPAGESQGSG